MNEAVQSQEQWLEASATGQITVEQLDALMREMHEKRAAYDAAKEASTALYKVFDDAERRLITALTQAGKRKYFAEGIGTVYFSEKLVVPTPKTIEQKVLLFDYIRKEFGDKYLLEKQSIHHQTLQSLYNESFKEAVENGKGEGFHIPGLEQPTAQISLNFRKDK